MFDKQDLIFLFPASLSDLQTGFSALQAGRPVRIQHCQRNGRRGRLEENEGEPPVLLCSLGTEQKHYN